MIIIGCDYHPGFQQIAFVDTDTGELKERKLGHREEAEQFYRDLKVRGLNARVGMEASGHARWFERLLADLHLELWIGDEAEIRTKRVRKQKTDRQDAELLLRLLMEERFPRIQKAMLEGRSTGTSSANDGLSMSIIPLLKTLTIVLIVSTALLSQQSTTPPSPPEKPAQQQPARAGTTSSPANAPKKTPAAAQPVLSPQKKAWKVLNAACTADKTSSRAVATRVLGLIPNNPSARKIAEKGLADDKPEVRAAAAAALGEMKSRSSIPKLQEELDDADPTVALAAAHALNLMHDDSGYDVYYEVLTGQRKSGKGLIASQTAILKDPKKMAQLGFEEGIGFIPFAGIGWEAFKVIKKDDASPIRAAAAKVLADDPDPDALKALTDAAADKSWLVRAAAIEALAKRGDPSAIGTIDPYMFDEKDAVKYTAAAAVVRLTTIQEAKDRKNDRKKMEQKR